MRNRYWLTIGIGILLVAVIVALFLWLSADTSDPEVPATDEESFTVSDEAVVLTEVPAVTEHDHVRGNADAPVTMIIYSDFDCEFCAEFSATVMQAQEAFGEQLRVVFRHNPLRTHAYAQAAAEASECAGEQQQFWQLHDALFAAVRLPAKSAGEQSLNSVVINDTVAALDLDHEQFVACLREGAYRERIAQQAAEAQAVGAYGTPTSFVNGRIVVGAVPFADYVPVEVSTKAGESERGPEQGLESIIKAALDRRS